MDAASSRSLGPPLSGGGPEQVSTTPGGAWRVSPELFGIMPGLMRAITTSLIQQRAEQEAMLRLAPQLNLGPWGSWGNVPAPPTAPGMDDVGLQRPPGYFIPLVGGGTWW